MQPPPPRREALPPPKQQEKSVSLWSILKECIGKDLSRICLPVYFNEPLSVLQKTVEDLEYAELVNKVHICWLVLSRCQVPSPLGWMYEQNGRVDNVPDASTISWPFCSGNSSAFACHLLASPALIQALVCCNLDIILLPIC